MQYKVAELEGPMLDAAVAMAEGIAAEFKPSGCYVEGLAPVSDFYSPSTDWEQGGPLIERGRIDVTYLRNPRGWKAQADDGVGWQYGTTPLIAAMRAYVASKFGDVVEMP